MAKNKTEIHVTTVFDGELDATDVFVSLISQKYGKKMCIRDSNYPTLAKTMEAISKYCEENGESYTFINDDEVEINGKRYEIYRGYENGSRGNYGIKCKEK